MSGADSGPRTRAAAADAVGEQRADGPSARRADAGSGAAAPVQYPAALLYGPGHLVVHGNPPFRELFGAGWLGLPAAEALLDLPRDAFDLMDLVYREGRPFACWITLRGAPWRLTVAERRDPGTGDVYGIAVDLVPRERD